jgi:5-oxoprolinase (ATP-hydrolysing) subunit A
VAHEAFAERRYEADGTLTPRLRDDAVIEELDGAVAQVRMLLRDGAVVARTGERVPLRMDTLCLHGDRSDAAAFARGLRATLEAEGVRIRAFSGEAA